MRRRKHLSDLAATHPEAPRLAMIVMVEEGSTHEAAVAAAAQAGSLLTLLAPDPTGQGRLLMRRYARQWCNEDQRSADVRIASLRHIQRAVDLARRLGINFEGVHLAGGRVVIFEPLPSFNTSRAVGRTQPLVLDLPRDPFAYYEQALAANEGLPRPVLAFSMRETKATAMAVGLASNAAITARHHIDCRYEGPRSMIDLDHLARWRDDAFRTEATFVPENDSGADLAMQVRLHT